MGSGILATYTWVSGAEQSAAPSPAVVGVANNTTAVLKWNNEAGGPTRETKYGLDCFNFEDGLTQPLTTVIKVPQDYVAGRQIKLRIDHFHEAASATQLLTAVATLIEDGDTIDSTTDQYTSTNTAQTGASKVVIGAILDLTNSSGQINSNAVAPGDRILVSITRGTDSSTSDVFMIEGSCEVTF